MIIYCLPLLSFCWITPIQCQGYPDIDRFHYMNNVKCVSRSDATKVKQNRPKSCVAQCNEVIGCRAVTLPKEPASKLPCEIHLTCNKQEPDSGSETWIRCNSSSICKTCKKDINVCEICDTNSGYTGPTCTDFGEKHFDGFRYHENYDCIKGSNLNLRFLKKRSDQCHTICKRRRKQCKGFAVDRNAECFIKKSCTNQTAKMKTYLWIPCAIGNCKICNSSVKNCDTCKDGWGGKTCRRRVNTPQPITPPPIAADENMKLLVKIMLYVLFGFTVISCIGYYVYQHRKQRRH